MSTTGISVFLVHKWIIKQNYNQITYKATNTFSEPFVESVPTITILPFLYTYFYESFDSKVWNGEDLLWITWITSYLSGSSGFIRFMKIGPCEILPSLRCNFDILILYLSIFASFIAKAFVLWSWLGCMKNYIVIIEITSCWILPQLIYVSILLSSAFKWNI